MLLICLYRDNEVGPEHIVSTTLLPRLDSSALIITLDHLTLPDVMAFVTESLRTPASTTVLSKPTQTSRAREGASVRQLSELVMTKTGGSPLFVAQVCAVSPSYDLDKNLTPVVACGSFSNL